MHGNTTKVTADNNTLFLLTHLYVHSYYHILFTLVYMLFFLIIVHLYIPINFICTHKQPIWTRLSFGMWENGN